ncbi:MAG: hypothetical protein KY462_08675 [Actinobacteria bacterium]|nr:hypothetical protein [Actinomycetota bacterium]
MSRDPTCVFDVDADLLRALEAALGPPIDSYLNGWQVWLEPAQLPGHAEPVELEYRLHPPHGFSQPAGLSHHDLWDTVIQQVTEDAVDVEVGRETRRLHQLWVLLEVYPTYREPVTAEHLRAAVEEVLGRSSLAAGYVDHDALGARWKRTKGGFDLPGAIRAELEVVAG